MAESARERNARAPRGSSDSGAAAGPARGGASSRALVEVSARRARLVIAASAVLLLVLICGSLMLGRYPIDPVHAVLMLVDRVVPVEQVWTDQQATLFFNVRLPRIALACMVGASLSAAGAAFQGTFRNPLVSPDVLGASQGAALGAAAALLAGMGSFAVSIWAFAAAMATVAVVMLVSARARASEHSLTVVLVGVMVSSLCQAGVSFAKLVADPSDQLPAITYWLMGSLTGARLSDVRFAAVPMAVGAAALLALRWRINLLTMGDDEARTMGVNARRLRVAVMVAATLLTAASVSVSGMIGWVGLVVPHVTRMVIGCDYRRLLPASMLAGASFLLVVDNVARLTYTAEIPIGILTAFLGAPFFLYLIMARRRGA